MPTKDEIRRTVRDHYRSIVQKENSCCGKDSDSTKVTFQLGYPDEALREAPAEANLGLGCGNPLATANLKPGETVLDLGSGAGFDCFLAGKDVGPTGLVIGVDMTPEMIARARENAQTVGATNIEFRLGEIEHLPVADASVDAIISNCVINLSPDKPQTYRDAFRVLKPDGRLEVSDVVLRRPLPEPMRGDLSRNYAQCVSGASTVGEIKQMLAEAGFIDVVVDVKESSKEFIKEWSSEIPLAAYIASAIIEAKKPGTRSGN